MSDPALRVRTCLLRLARAVQQSAIYPPSHPALARGIEAFGDALDMLVEAGPVSIAVGRQTLLVSIAGGEPAAHEAPWLASRLFERQVSMLSFEQGLESAEAVALVTWLTTPVERDAPFPALTGVTMARLDLSRLVFVDEARTSNTATAADEAWRVLTASLGGEEAARDRQDLAPAALATVARRVLHAAEGTGGTELAEKLVRAHGHWAALPPESRADVTKRLAALVDLLTPELAGTLLTMRSTDDDGKIGTVTEILPHASPDVLGRLVANLTVREAPAQGAFADFLRKLARATACDPTASEVFGHRLQAAGLPREWVETLGADEMRRPETADPAAEADRAPFTPKSYQARLTTLVTTHVEPGRTLVSTDCLEADALDDHIASILCVQARKPAEHDALPGYLTTLSAIRDRAAARRGLQTLAEVASLIVHLRALSAPVGAEVARQIAEAEHAFADPAIVSLAVSVLRDSGSDTGGPLATSSMSAASDHRGAEARQATAMLLAGGRPVARTLADRIAHAAAAERPVLVRAITAFGTVVLAEELAPKIAESRSVAEACAAALATIDSGHGFDLAMILVDHHHREVRGPAIAWLTEAGLSTSRWRQALQRILDGDHVDVIAPALEAARARPAAQSRDAVLAFVRRPGSDATFDLRLRAVALLVGFGEGALMDLTAVLAERHWTFQRQERWLAGAIARRLGRTSDTGVAHAVHAWSRSPAGLWSLISPPPGEPS